MALLLPLLHYRPVQLHLGRSEGPVGKLLAVAEEPDSEGLLCLKIPLRKHHFVDKRPVRVHEEEESEEGLEDTTCI